MDFGIDISGGGKVIASCGNDKTVRAWTLQGGNEWTMSAAFVHTEAVTCMVLTADALHAITSDDKGSIESVKYSDR